jgi:hypothetical protein
MTSDLEQVRFCPDCGSRVKLDKDGCYPRHEVMLGKVCKMSRVPAKSLTLEQAQRMVALLEYQRTEMGKQLEEMLTK